jgi:hypothetical protein
MRKYSKRLLAFEECVEKLWNSELKEAIFILEKEIRLSDKCIEQGLETKR